MKLLSRNREQGGTLVVTLVVAITIGTVLGAYLSLISNRYQLTMRSQCWNNAIPVLEAGIEEAFTHLRQDGTNNLGANGWTNGVVGGQSVYAKQRTLPDGTVYYTVIYNGATTNPVIYSTGFVPAPRHPETYISRTVRVTGSYPPPLNGPVVATGELQMKGNSVAVDSFNSSLSWLSKNGLYDPNRTSSNGNVVCVGGPLDISQHTIHGSLYLGPDVPVSDVPDTQVTGGVYTDFDLAYPDATLPDVKWNPPPFPIKVGKTFIYDFSIPGNYYVSAQCDVVVEPGVNVTLRVDSASLVPTSIHIMAKNGISGSLTIYQVAGDGTLPVVNMDIPRARYFTYYGLPGVTSIKYNGNTSFTGVIYAPEATVILDGGGNDIGFIGACIAKNIYVKGNHLVFHYDEDILAFGPPRRLVPSSWQEL